MLPLLCAAVYPFALIVYLFRITFTKPPHYEAYYEVQS
jgi:general stress protein CsbA